MVKITKKYKYYKFYEKNRTAEEADLIFQQRISDAKEIYEQHKHSFKHRNCPYCGFSNYINLDKFHNTYEISECTKCRGQYVNPAPSLEAISDYYNNGKCNVLLDNLFKKRRTNSENFILDDRINKVIEYLKKISKHKTKVKILELGCGSGSFLSKLKNSIEHHYPDTFCIDYSGIDVDKNAVNSKVDDSLNLIASSVENFAKNNQETYDIILHFELIEHLIDPELFMLSAKSLMGSGSTMIFTTPNQCGLEMVASHYNSYRLLAHSIFPPMHLNSFSTINISHFAIRCGFNIMEIQTPGNFDVDMISVTKEHVLDPFFCDLDDLDEDTKAYIQKLISKLGVSSHMQCVLEA